MTNSLFIRDICFVLCLCCDAVVAAEGRVTIAALDEAGLPVVGARVQAGFSRSIAAGQGWGSGPSIKVAGTTDTNGLCTLSGNGDGGVVAFSASMDGFYSCGGYEVIFTNRGGLLGSKWQPWNPVVTMRMQRIVNPIPLIAKVQGDMRYETPLESGEIAYDLMKGDWVQPHGVGQVRDFIFRFERTLGAVTKSGYQLYEAAFELRFANEGDGILVTSAPERPTCGPRLPTQAPLSGYATNWSATSFRREKTMSQLPGQDMCYYFKVRSEKSPGGVITNSLYGKIYGPIEHSLCGGRLGLRFQYYLNPTPNDRNLEYDQQRNLMPDKNGPYLSP